MISTMDCSGGNGTNTHLLLHCTRNGDDVVSLCEKPCERDLYWCRVVLLANGGDCIDDGEKFGKILCGESTTSGKRTWSKLPSERLDNPERSVMSAYS